MVPRANTAIRLGTAFFVAGVSFTARKRNEYAFKLTENSPFGSISLRTTNDYAEPIPFVQVCVIREVGSSLLKRHTTAVSEASNA